MKYLLISYDRKDYKEVSYSFILSHYFLDEFYESFDNEKEMYSRICELKEIGFTKQIF